MKQGMKRYGLDPENMRTCNHCSNSVYDLSKGYLCHLHPEVNMQGTLIHEVTDCDDWKTPYLSIGSTTRTYERRIKKKGGGEE